MKIEVLGVDFEKAAHISDAAKQSASTTLHCASRFYLLNFFLFPKKLIPPFIFIIFICELVFLVPFYLILSMNYFCFQPKRIQNELGRKKTQIHLCRVKSACI